MTFADNTGIWMEHFKKHFGVNETGKLGSCQFWGSLNIHSTKNWIQFTR